MKKIIILFLLLVFIVVFILVSVVIGGNEYNDLNFKNFVLEDNLLKVDVYFTEASGKTFRKYKYKIDGENLYLTINSGLAIKNIGTGDLQIEIHDSNLNSVKNVYIKSGNKTKIIMNK